MGTVVGAFGVRVRGRKLAVRGNLDLRCKTWVVRTSTAGVAVVACQAGGIVAVVVVIVT